MNDFFYIAGGKSQIHCKIKNSGQWVFYSCLIKSTNL